MKISHKAKSLAEALNVDAQDLNFKIQAISITASIEKVTPSLIAMLLKKEFSKRELLYLATENILNSLSKPKKVSLMDILKSMTDEEKGLKEDTDKPKKEKEGE